MIAARVDGTGYILQGAQRANYMASRVNATSITPTRTIFTMDAGPVRLNLTYLTPIEVSHLVFRRTPLTEFQSWMIGHVIPCHLDTFLLTSGRLMGIITVSNSTLTCLVVNICLAIVPGSLIH